MSKKMMLLALSAVAALALAALPALASAATPLTDTSTGKTVNFTGTSGASQLRSIFGTVNCTSDHNSGTFNNNSSTGTVEITFTGCTGPFGEECENKGVGTGEITTGTSVTHLVYIKGGVKTVGVLVTPPSGGVYASFTCHTGLGPVTVTVTGNGIIGHMSAPKCGETSSKFTITFEAEGRTQKYREVEGENTVYSLSQGGGAAAQTGTENGTISGGATSTLTCP
jgi:hypothetical protein